MALNALAIAFIFAFTVSGVRGCDPKFCCCPNGELAASQVGTTVKITYTAASGSGCKDGLVTSSCDVTSNVCSTSSNDFNYSARKNGGAVSVTDRSVPICSMNLQCSTATPTCEDNDDWTGSYTVVSGSKGVVVSATCLLIATLSGILI